MSRVGLGRMEMQQILPSAGNNHTLAATLPAEERRGARVPVRVPVNVAVGDDSPFPAITSNISRYGALILSSIPVPVGSIVWVQNARTSVWARVRVVWTATHPEMGPHHIGVELVNDGPHVWADERDRP
jgi:PilZ domain-containing protein